MSLSLVTAPAHLPVELDDMKAFVRVDFDDDDELLDSLIRTATQRLDGPHGRLGRCLIRQTWSLTLERTPREIAIPLSPVSSLVGISDLDLASYTVHRLHDLDGTIIRPAAGSYWPTSSADRVVTFVAGFGDTPDRVPEPIRTAIMMHVAHLYDHRESVTQGSGYITETPYGYDDLITPYRTWSF